MRTSEGPEVKNFRHYSLGEIGIVEIKIGVDSKSSGSR